LEGGEFPKGKEKYANLQPFAELRALPEFFNFSAILLRSAALSSNLGRFF
jgi:hypothetical protein